MLSHFGLLGEGRGIGSDKRADSRSPSVKYRLIMINPPFAAIVLGSEHAPPVIRRPKCHGLILLRLGNE